MLCQANPLHASLHLAGSFPISTFLKPLVKTAFQKFLKSSSYIRQHLKTLKPAGRVPPDAVLFCWPKRVRRKGPFSGRSKCTATLDRHCRLDEVLLLWDTEVLIHCGPRLPLCVGGVRLRRAIAAALRFSTANGKGSFRSDPGTAYSQTAPEGRNVSGLSAAPQQQYLIRPSRPFSSSNVLALRRRKGAFCLLFVAAWTKSKSAGGTKPAGFKVLGSPSAPWQKIAITCCCCKL